MLDAGMVAGALLEAPQWRRTRDLLVRLGGLESTHVAASLAFLVSLHDIGKASPGFQRLVPDLWQDAQAAGFADGHPLWRSLRFRHDIEGFAILAQDVLPARITPQLGEAPRPRRRRVFSGLAQALGAHHGAFISPAEVEEHGYPQVRPEGACAADEPWLESRAGIIEALAEAFVIDNPIIISAEHLSGFCSILNGLTTLADWLASNEAYFACAGPTPLETYREQSTAQASAAITDAGLLRYPAPRTAPTFATLFPGYRPRPLQAALDAGELVDLPQPQLVVIEAPTGEGKTEAALLLAERLLATCGGGLYFALPTTATSEQLFRRLASFFGEGRGGTGAVGLALVHGQAELSDEVARITSRDHAGAGELTEPVVIDSWLLPRKRALLAPFAVGTVDQAMLAALRVRHGSLRQLGLAGKVLVIDEVHAYDAFMDVIIERLLTWLAELGVSVILLSATLPASTRTRLLAAYHVDAVAEDEDAAYPLITLGSPGERVQRLAPPASDPGREVSLTLVATGESERTLTDALAAARGDAAVGWVCDTVAAAQETYRKARSLLAGTPEERRPRLVLYHARLLAGQRRRVEALVDHLVGKAAAREGGCLIVATQVIEQSLDIDFDLLVSDIAPIDLVLQRVGRLHRHQRGIGQARRPESLRRPRLLLLGAGIRPVPDAQVDASQPWLARHNAAVYGTAALLRSLATLRECLDGRPLAIPQDIAPFVRVGYDPATSPPPGWESVWAEADAAEADHDLQQRAKAAAFLLALPQKLADFRDWAEADASDPDESPQARAHVRDTEDTVEVVVVCRAGSALRAFPGSGVPDDLDVGGQLEPPPDAVARMLAGCTLRLPTAMTAGSFSGASGADRGARTAYARIDAVIDDLERQGRGLDEAWSQSPWLRKQLPLILDEDMRATVAGWALEYDRRRGLRRTRVGKDAT